MTVAVRCFLTGHDCRYGLFSTGELAVLLLLGFPTSVRSTLLRIPAIRFTESHGVIRLSPHFLVLVLCAI